MATGRRLSLLDSMAGAHSVVWSGLELARQNTRVLASGHAALDAELPGGGWPLDGMVELLQPSAGSAFWQLVLPALVQAVGQGPGPVVLVGAPYTPFGPALAAQGLPANRLLWLRPSLQAHRLWAAEQALRCAEVAAVLAWLPQARDAELRRLQLAAQEQSRLLFVLRDANTAPVGSPARLRLRIEAAPTDPSEPAARALEVRILKRRGPPLELPLSVPLHAQPVQALWAARAAGARWGADVSQPAPRAPERAAPSELQVAAAAASEIRTPRLRIVAGGPAHALDRAAAA